MPKPLNTFERDFRQATKHSCYFTWDFQQAWERSCYFTWDFQQVWERLCYFTQGFQQEGLFGCKLDDLENDERLEISDERLCVLLSKLSPDVHSQLCTMDDGWHGFLPYAKALFSTSDERLEINEDVILLLTTDDTDETVLYLTQRRKEAQRRFGNPLLLIPKITQTSLVMFIY